MTEERKEAGAPEIEITPEMIKAGSEVIWRSFNDVVPWGSPTSEGVAIEVFEAMCASAVPTNRSVSRRRK